MSLQAVCTCCKKLKSADQFYKNSSKKNGLESNCKECVLERKAKKYKVKKMQKKKTKYLRLLKRVNVLDTNSCTLQESWINRPASKDRFEMLSIILKELV